MNKRYTFGIICTVILIWWTYNKLPQPLNLCENATDPCLCNNAAFKALNKFDVQKLLFNGKVPELHPLMMHYLCKYHIYKNVDSKEYNLQDRLENYGVNNDISLALQAAGVSSNKPGFFVECGANDGEFLSNTIGLEIQKGWHGLLVEASPSLFTKLQSKHRRAWTADVCLSGKPEKLEFLKSKNQSDWRKGIGKINGGKKYDSPKHIGSEVFKKEDYKSEGMVECFPLISILAAINVKAVDLFSLDVEGHEYKIIEVIPFDKLDIKVIIVEHWWAPEGKLAIKSILEGHGYRVHSERLFDYIFVKTIKV